jgi:hypothetical protein
VIGDDVCNTSVDCYRRRKILSTKLGSNIHQLHLHDKVFTPSIQSSPVLRHIDPAETAFPRPEVDFRSPTRSSCHPKQPTHPTVTTKLRVGPVLGLWRKERLISAIYVIRERECLACSVPDLFPLKRFATCFPCYSSLLYTYTYTYPSSYHLTLATLHCLIWSCYLFKRKKNKHSWTANGNRRNRLSNTATSPAIARALA